MKPARRIAVIDVGKTNAKLVIVDGETGQELASRTTPNRSVPTGPYPHYDVDRLWASFLSALRDFARDPGIDTGIFVVNTAPDLVFDGIPVGAGSDRDAVPLVRVEPTYPPRAQQQGLEGWVQLQFNISATGAVTDVSVVASEPGTTFDGARKCSASQLARVGCPGTWL